MEMNRAMKEASRHRKNSTLLMAIAIMFALCWFPLTLLNLLADYNHGIFMYNHFLLAFAVAHLVAMISACLNPIIYGWFNQNFRREFSRIVCFWRDDELFMDGEKRQLVAKEAALIPGSEEEPKKTVAKKTYKAIQTQTSTRSPIVRQDSPMTIKDSLDLNSTCSSNSLESK